MNKRLNLQSLTTQYFIGLSVNVLYVVLLLSSNVGYKHIHLPAYSDIDIVDYGNNTWPYFDVQSYVLLAKAFLERGEFACCGDYLPGYYRTIGYPSFLSVMMKIFGDNWHVFTIFLQAIIFAFVYPALSKISMLLFPEKRWLTAVTFCVYLFLGLYLTFVPLILTDLFFAVFFTIGLCFGLISVIRQSWIYLILELIFIGYAAQVRPTLVYYPVVHALVLFAVARKHQISNVLKVKKLIVVSCVLLMFLCSLPSIRTYLNYGIFKPTDGFEINLRCLAKDVLLDRNKADVYEAEVAKIKATKDIKEKLKLRAKYTFATCKKYPWTTIKIYAKKGIKVIGQGYWIWPTRLFSKSEPSSGPKLIAYIVQLPINIAFMLFLINLLRSKELLSLFTIIIFISYFLIPAFFSGDGSRLRLPFDGLVIMFAVYQITLFAPKVAKIFQRPSTSI